MTEPSESLEISERWIQDQSVALGCSLLRAIEGGTPAQQNMVFSHLWPNLLAPEPAQQDAYRRKLELLPPTTLQALCAFPVGELSWSEHVPFWRAALKAQRTVVKGGRSTPVAGARLLAERLLHGEFSPQQLIRLAKLELGVDWPDAAAPHLAALIARLKKDQCVAGLAAFRDSGVRLQRWELIENDLLHREFAWPLLILRSDGFDAISCALPIGVHVLLGQPKTMLDVSFLGGEGLDGSEWKRPAVRALSAAIDLWEHEHSSWDQAFARDIRSAKATLDLRVAEKILEPYRGLFAVDLCDDSLEAYLALVILGQFIGHKGVDTICATGKLGARMRDVKGANYCIDPVDIGPKIAGAEAAFFYEQIIIPGGQDDVTTYTPHLRVNWGAKFSDYAEHAMSQAWRKHRYVRVPDLAAAFKRYRRKGNERRRIESPSPEDQDQIDRVLDLLELSTEPVLQLPADITPANAMAALYEVSHLAAHDDDFPAPHYEKLPAFATIRTAESEGSERFWRVVWEMLGWSDADLKRFNFTVNGSAAAEMLAKQMNRFVPTRAEPVRAPDLLMIVGSEHFPPPSPLAEGPFSRLHISRLTTALTTKLPAAKRLRPTSNAAVRRRIGATRILLVADPRTPAPRLVNLPDSPLFGALQKLAVFRHGFTYEMARRIVGLDDASFAGLFSDLLALRDEDRPVLVEATSASEFFLAAKPPVAQDLAMARLHYAAANAIVGFLDPQQHGHRLDLSVGLSARWVHEAQWHLWESRSLARSSPGTTGRALAARCVIARERVNRIAEPFSWSRLRWANQSSSEEGRDTWETLCMHIDQLPTGALIHPLELLWAAKFTYKLEQDPTGPIDAGDRRIAFLDAAEAACKRVARAEGDACRFAIATTRAVMIMQADPTLNGFREAEPWTKAAMGLMEQAREIIDADWFECRGDAALNDALAAPLYRLGFANPNIKGAYGANLSVVVKYVAACARAGVPLPNDVVEMIDKVEDRGRVWLADNAEASRRTGGLYKEPHVADRWERGRRLIGRMWKAPYAR